MSDVGNGPKAPKAAKSKRPQISIIVVAQNVENYIQQALRSITEQMTDEIELIYVDNGSTDATLRLARQIRDEAAPHAVHLIESETNLGLGEGRNVGMAKAQGAYVMFLDGDDWIARDALPQLCALARLHAPDVLVYNHARYYPDGRLTVNRTLAHIRQGWVETSAQRKQVLANLNVAWNKLYRHDFVRENGLKFGTGFYEDIDWNFEAMLRAERLYVYPEQLVFYRQRPGSILRSVDPRHFDVFQQWNNVLDFLASRPDLADIYGEDIERYAQRQMGAVLHADNRVPEDMKPAFFAEMSKVWRRFESELKFHPHRRRIDDLISHNQYRAYVAFLALVKQKSEITTSLKRLRRRHITDPIRKRRTKLLKDLYALFLKLPMSDRRVVFEAYWGKRMDCNPYALFKELSELGGYECIWVLREEAEDRPDFPYERVTPGSLRHLWALATSKYLISNVNFPTEYDKRPGSIHVQTKHGTPLKVMGLDIRPVRPREMDWSAFATRCQRWDYVISSNAFSSRVWRQGFPYNYKVLETGYPRNDVFYNATADDVARIKKQLNIPEGKKVALYAPTFRDKDRDKNKLLDFAECFEPKRVLDALGPDYVLLLRGHYLIDTQKAELGARVLDVSSHVDANEVCLVSDVLITDYSSIMFDYANLNRPIVLYLYDYDDYMKARGTYFDIREQPPGPIATTEAELLETLRNATWSSPQNMERLAKFRATFCAFDDGRASARVIKEVFGVDLPEKLGRARKEVTASAKQPGSVVTSRALAKEAATEPSGD